MHHQPHMAVHSHMYTHTCFPPPVPIYLVSALQTDASPLFLVAFRVDVLIRLPSTPTRSSSNVGAGSPHAF